MLNNNKKLGNSFEKKVAEKLSNLGYWATLLNPNNVTGAQPRRYYCSKR